MTIDTKALRGLLERNEQAGLMPLEVVHSPPGRKSKIIDSLGNSLTAGDGRYDPEEAELIVEGINALPELITAYEERDRKHIDFDPNLNYSGKMSDKTVRLTFGLWKYRKTMTVTVGGNCSGLDNIGTAIGQVFDNLSECTDQMYKGQPQIILVDNQGEELLCTDEENRQEDWLKDLTISAEIIDIQPEELEPKQ